MEEAPNLSYVEEISGEDHDFEQQFIQLFKEEFLWEVGAYLYHIKREELRAASEIVAKSKYKLIMLGLRTDSVLANLHEENLQMGKMGMHQDFRKILGKVNAFLEHI